jgi:hypothetical protein
LETEAQESLNESLQVHVTDEVCDEPQRWLGSAKGEDGTNEETTETVVSVPFLKSGGQLAAEQEASNLKSDLALVLRVTDEEEADED